MAKTRELVKFRVDVPTVDLQGTVRYLVEDLRVSDFNIKLLSSSHSPLAGTRRTYRITCTIPKRKVDEVLRVFHNRKSLVS